MKTLLILLLCVALLPFPVCSQAQVPDEHVTFGVEDVFQRPVSLPQDALQALRASNDERDIIPECAMAEGIQPSEIPAAWFVASRIQLNRSSSAFVVRGENRCLMGAHSAHFWVLGKSATGGYTVVFRGFGDGLSVLSTRTNHYRDLELTILTGVAVESIKSRFSDGSYHEAGHTIEHH